MNLLAALFVAFFLQQQTASIEGTIVQVGTARPIARAVVQVTGDRSVSFSVETGADGKFQFANLPGGQYQIKATRNGYMDGAFGQRSPKGRGRSLSVAGGQAVKDIRIVMVPLGAISGRVYDDRGEPLANVNVQALKYSYQDGQASLQAVKSAMTNDRGEYRLFWLPPGEYYVGTTPGTSIAGMVLQIALAKASPVRIAPEPEPGGPNPVDYAPVYYPGTADTQLATPVVVRAGADLGGIDFTLMRVTPRKIRGSVLDGATGQPVKSASITLAARGASIMGSIARPATDGTFELRDVYPGSYFLVATSTAAGSQVSGGRIPVEIANSDLEGIIVTMSPSITISGTIEGLRGSPPESLYPLIALKPLAPANGRTINAYAEFKNSGELTIPDVIEGDYRLQITEIPGGSYLKSARFGAADALNDTLHVDSRTAERLAIVLGADGGSIEGVVTDRSKNAAANASIALLPINVRQPRPDLFKKTSADDLGRFQLREIAPGDYIVFAWDDVEESVWWDPEFIRRNEALGKRVHIGANGRETVELTAIPFVF